MFETFIADDVRDLIHEFPLAWVCASGGRADHASLLPLIGGYDGDGRLTHLIGHMARGNPLFAALTKTSEALILFNGPNAYVSPEQAGLRDWAPTWIYAQVRIEAKIVFEPEQTGAALDTLIDAMEVGRPEPWHSGELGARYASMLNAIIGFRAEVTMLAGKFKLGQDERPKTLASILQSLVDPALIRWIRRFNPAKD
ncbi:MAG: transcriptional regulator [Sphingomonadales bacterium]|nr:transcriptional regulator [Sphingomonadales bacterium]